MSSLSPRAVLHGPPKSRQARGEGCFATGGKRARFTRAWHHSERKVRRDESAPIPKWTAPHERRRDGVDLIGALRKPLSLAATAKAVRIDMPHRARSVDRRREDMSPRVIFAFLSAGEARTQAK